MNTKVCTFCDHPANLESIHDDTKVCAYHFAYDSDWPVETMDCNDLSARDEFNNEFAALTDYFGKLPFAPAECGCALCSSQDAWDTALRMVKLQKDIDEYNAHHECMTRGYCECGV